MGCCFCCLSEGDKVGRVLAHFPGYPASQAQDGALQKVIGCVTLATTTGFYSPVTRSPCAYFRIRISEEWKEVYYVNIDGRQERRVRKIWKQVCDEERFTDFYLQDGNTKVFVNGSNRGMCKVQASTDSWGSSGRYWDAPPPGVQDFIAANLPSWEWRNRGEHRTGRYRFNEKKFEINEKVAGFGMIKQGVDPLTNQAVKILTPAAETDIDETFMEENEFSSWDKKSWHQMTNPPSILLSDNVEFTKDIAVTPAVNLPTYMTQYVPEPGAAVAVANASVPAVVPAVVPAAVTSAPTKVSTPGAVDFKLLPRHKQMALKTMADLRGEHVFIVNASTESTVRMTPQDQIRGIGGLGPWAKWKVVAKARDASGPVVAFQNLQTGKFLAIREGTLTWGQGGMHCEFIVQRAQMAVFLVKRQNPRARAGFNQDGSAAAPGGLGDGPRARFFIFDCDEVGQQMLD